MKKTALLLTFCLLFSLAACGEGQPGPTEPEDSSGVTIGESGVTNLEGYDLTLVELKPAGSLEARANAEFVRLVEERTGGRIQIAIEQKDESGSEYELLNGLRTGETAFGSLSASHFYGLGSELDVLQIPLLFEGPEHLWAVLDSELGAGMLSGVSRSGAVGLALYDTGFMQFALISQTDSSLSLNGLKLGIDNNQGLSRLAEAMGGTPMPGIPQADLTLAMESGFIDGGECSLVNYVELGIYETAPFLRVDNHISIPGMLLVSQEIWGHISEADREIVRACASEAGVYQRSLYGQSEEAAAARLEEEGIQVTAVPAEELTDIRAVILEQYTAGYGETIERIEAMK